MVGTSTKADVLMDEILELLKKHSAEDYVIALSDSEAEIPRMLVEVSGTVLWRMVNNKTELFPVLRSLFIDAKDVEE